MDGDGMTQWKFGGERRISDEERGQHAICTLHAHPETVCAECCYTDNGYCQCEFHGNPSPYTLASLRFFRDARGKTHYY